MAERQETIFLNGEGDAWHHRNKDKEINSDPVLDALLASKIEPKNVAEIGCGRGWRLNLLKGVYECEVFGLEPSSDAIKYANEHYHDLKIFHGVSGTIEQWSNNRVDMVIFGFCLYLISRDELFFLAYHTDRILKDGGHIVIHDFMPDTPHKKSYHHKAGVFSYKMDYAKLWLGNPAYTRIYNSITPEDGYGVSILKKDTAAAWPLRT